MEQKKMPAKSEFLLYQSKDGKLRMETRLENETVWLTQKQLAELFQTTVANINIHIKNIYGEGELEPDRTIKDFLIVKMRVREKSSGKLHITIWI